MSMTQPFFEKNLTGGGVLVCNSILCLKKSGAFFFRFCNPILFSKKQIWRKGRSRGFCGFVTQLFYEKNLLRGFRGCDSILFCKTSGGGVGVTGLELSPLLEEIWRDGGDRRSGTQSFFEKRIWPGGFARVLRVCVSILF